MEGLKRRMERLKRRMESIPRPMDPMRLSSDSIWLSSHSFWNFGQVHLTVQLLLRAVQLFQEPLPRLLEVFKSLLLGLEGLPASREGRIVRAPNRGSTADGGPSPSRDARPALARCR